MCFLREAQMKIDILKFILISVIPNGKTGWKDCMTVASHNWFKALYCGKRQTNTKVERLQY